MKTVVVNVKVTLSDDDPRSADEIAAEILRASAIFAPDLDVEIQGWRLYQ